MMTDSDDFLRVQMGTPKLAEAALEFAANVGQDLMTVLSQSANTTIPRGLRAGFMDSALRHLKDSRRFFPVYVPEPDTLYYYESVTGEVYWKEIS